MDTVPLKSSILDALKPSSDVDSAGPISERSEGDQDEVREQFSVAK